MHIVVSGGVVVTRNGAEVARRGEGDVVGEMAIIADQPRMATLVADGDVRLLSIGRTQFTAILRERPDTALAVIACWYNGWPSARPIARGTKISGAANRAWPSWALVDGDRPRRR